jgi:hypothetical protein
VSFFLKRKGGKEKLKNENFIIIVKSFVKKISLLFFVDFFQKAVFQKAVAMKRKEIKDDDQKIKETTPIVTKESRKKELERVLMLEESLENKPKIYKIVTTNLSRNTFSNVFYTARSIETVQRHHVKTWLKLNKDLNFNVITEKVDYSSRNPLPKYLVMQILHSHNDIEKLTWLNRFQDGRFSCILYSWLSMLDWNSALYWLVESMNDFLQRYGNYDCSHYYHIEKVEAESLHTRADERMVAKQTLLEWTAMDKNVVEIIINYLRF